MSDTREFRRAERALNALERSGDLTEQGRKWLIQAVDPFHDKDIEATGFPDAYLAPGLVQRVMKKITIAKDAALPAGNWDCNVFSLPWIDGQPLSSYSLYKNILTGGSGAGTGAATAAFGGIAALSCTANGVMAFAGAGTAATSVGVDDTFLDGPCRVVAAGFEVTNTTAEIYKQGDVTVYRIPEAQQQRSSYTTSIAAAAPFLSSNAPSPMTITAEMHSRPPLSVAESQYMIGSRTWSAAEGVYIPLTLTSTEIPIRDNDSTSVIFPYNVATNGYTPVALTCAVDSVLNTTVPATRKCVTTPFNMGGAFFSGLSDQTTLTISAIWYIERFPTILQYQLAVLAKPPPMYDPVALELYALMLRSMPTGVMVKENGLGEWFAEVVGSIAPFAEGMLSAIPHPYAQVGAQVARIAGKAADKYRVPPGEKGDAMKAKLKAKRAKAKSAGKSAGKAVKGKGKKVA